MQVPQLSVQSQWSPTSSAQLILWVSSSWSWSHCSYSHSSHSGSLAQWLVVDLCICFHLFLEESYSFSEVVDYGLVILCFMSGIHFWGSVYLSFWVWIMSLRIFFLFCLFTCKFKDVIVFCHWVVLCCVNGPYFLHLFLGWEASMLFPGFDFYK